MKPLAVFAGRHRGRKTLVFDEFWRRMSVVAAGKPGEPGRHGGDLEAALPTHKLTLLSLGLQVKICQVPSRSSEF